MKKIQHKKVTYTLEESVINMITKRSLILDISRSKLVSYYIEHGYEMMIDDYYNNNKQPLVGIVKKRKNTIPQTFTISEDILYIIDFFSEKLDIKKSHLVMSCVVNFERELKRKEDEKLSKEIDELMILMEENYPNK